MNAKQLLLSLALGAALLPTFAEAQTASYFARTKLFKHKQNGSSPAPTPTPTPEPTPSEPAIPPAWLAEDWSEWSTTCGPVATHTRVVQCIENDVVVADAKCTDPKPAASETDAVWSGCTTFIHNGDLQDGTNYWTYTNFYSSGKVDEKFNYLAIGGAGTIAQETYVPLAAGRLHVFTFSQVRWTGTGLNSQVTVEINGQQIASQSNLTAQNTGISFVPSATGFAKITITNKRTSDPVKYYNLDLRGLN